MNAELRHRGNLLMAAWTINSLAYSIVYPFIPIYLHEERGVPIELVGTIFPLMGLAVVLAPLLSGRTADHLGRNFAMRAGLFGRTGLFVLLALLALFEAPFWCFVPVLMLNAGAGNFFEVGSDAYLTDLAAPEERSQLYAKIRIGANIGWAVGPMLGAFLARTPFSLLFALTALLCLGGGLFVGANCPEVRRRRDPAEAPAVWNWRVLIRQRTLLRLLGSAFLLYLLTSQLYSVLSVYATGAVGVSRNTLGLIYSVNGFTIILFQLPTTRLLDRRGVSQLSRLLTGTMLYAAGYFSLGFALGGRTLAFSVLVLTLGEVLVQPAIYQLVSRLAPAGAAGRCLATLVMTRGIGYALGPYLGTLAFGRTATVPILLWGILASFALPAFLGFLSLRREEEKKTAVSVETAG